ncbi:MAG: hypothetical protein IJZ03_06220 [Clostridia bacterium]|nr:hypothetical protein [Clostridia bacterium]
MKESIYAALRGEFVRPELPDIGTIVDNIYTVILCPVCGQKTLDNYYICGHCGWEYDNFPEDHHSAANGATLQEYRDEYNRIIKERS